MIRQVDDDAAGVPLYQLKITLRRSKPPIWRRVIVRADMKLDRLHRVIQTAMGWMDCHLHQFRVGQVCFGAPSPEALGWGPEMMNEKRYVVADLASTVKQKFIYDYDFGDGWEHEVRLEKLLPPDPEFKHPVCLAGANACPPEDCGGVWGYADLLAALADPKHEQHKEMTEWIGGEWDPTRFSADLVTACLRRVKA